MATYFAVSTENAGMCGWSILAIASTRKEAEERGTAALPKGYDMRADTWRKNFEVVSETAGRRRGFLNDYTIEAFLANVD